MSRISVVMPRDLAPEAYPGATLVERPTHVLLPGLVNAHTHAGMTLFRGMADDLTLDTWLRQHIWPAESR
ncbi:MAG: hypothetical protein R3F24_11765 [Gammaproteobacteria bacterium]